MPTYVYKCDNVNHKGPNSIEIQQSIHDEPLKQCPYCKSKYIRRVPTNVSLQFNGDGWSTKTTSH